MGKSKSKAPKAKAAKPKLDKSFECHFCNTPGVVEVEMNRKKATGTLQCKYCNVKFTMRITNIMEPVDVYSEWTDRCEDENKGIDLEDELRPRGSALDKAAPYRSKHLDEEDYYSD